MDDESINKAVNTIITEKGGLSVTDGEHTNILPLPIAALMSTDNCETVAENIQHCWSLADKLVVHYNRLYDDVVYGIIVIPIKLKTKD